MKTGSFNNYEMMVKLGYGSQGSVWKVLRRRDNKIISLKRIPAFVDSDKYKISQNEIEKLELISDPCHPNLSCYYDHYYDPIKETVLIEMEYIDGTTLDYYCENLRAKGAFPVLYKHLLLILKDLIKGIVYLHENNILHNDIKPGNIMIDFSLTPRLIDFGISCTTEKQVQCESETACCIGFNGTPGFAAPEMILKNIRYPPSDIWSLGITFYNAATDKYPFNYKQKHPTIIEYIQTIDDPTIIPKELNTPNKLLNTIINRSIRKRPDDRIKTDEINHLLMLYK